MALSDDSPLSLTLRTKLEKAEEELKNKDQELEELKKQSREKEDKLREEIEQLNKENIKLKELLWEVEGELKEAKKELKETKKELEEELENSKSLIEANEYLKNECIDSSSLKEKYTGVFLQKEELAQKNKSLDNENEEQASRNYDLTKEVESLKIRLAALERQVSVSSDTFDGSHSRPDMQLSLEARNNSRSSLGDAAMSPTFGQLRRQDSELEMAELMTLLAPAADKWRLIGTQLYIPQSNLNSIEKRYHDDKECLLHTLNTWHEKCHEKAPYTLETIYRVLSSEVVDRKDLIPRDKR